MGLLMRSLRLKLTSLNSTVFGDTSKHSAIILVGTSRAHNLTVKISIAVGSTFARALAEQSLHRIALAHFTRVQEQRLYLDLSGVTMFQLLCEVCFGICKLHPNQREPILELGQSTYLS
jgi:flavin-binding protein dodecin